MKQGGIVVVCLFIAFLLVPIAADDRTVNLESRVIISFDKEDDTLDIDGNPVHWDWQDPVKDATLYCSKFISPAQKDKNGNITSPVLKYIDSKWPISLWGTDPKNKDKLRILGLRAAFDRKGYNTIKILPFKTVDGKSLITEVPFPGRVKQIDVWVWGSNFHFELYAYVKDFNGIPYKIDMGSLNFDGWKNIRCNVPDNIPQQKPTLPRHTGVTFLGFEVETGPNENVSGFQVFFDQMKVLTDTFETLYDGDDLATDQVFNSAAGGQTK